MPFDWVPRGDLLCEALRFVVAAAQKARGFQVVIEQIVESLFVIGIERDGLLEVSARLGSVSGSEKRRRGLGTAAESAGEP